MQEKEQRKEEQMANKEEKVKLSEKQKQEQIKKKMELELKKLRVQLARMRAKAKNEILMNGCASASSCIVTPKVMLKSTSTSTSNLMRTLTQMTKRCTAVTTALVEFIIDVCRLLCWQLPKSRAKTWLT